MSDILDCATQAVEAPCKWCGYNGTNYWQEGSHPRHCPWHYVGGGDARETLFIAYMTAGNAASAMHLLDTYKYDKKFFPVKED